MVSDEEADRAEGAFASFLRCAGVDIEWDGTIVPSRMEPSSSGKLRIGPLKVGNVRWQDEMEMQGCMKVLMAAAIRFT